MTLLIIGIILAALGAIGCMYGVWNIFNNYVYLVFTGGMGGAVTLLVVSFLMLVAGVVLLIIGIVQYNKGGTTAGPMGMASRPTGAGPVVPPAAGPVISHCPNCGEKLDPGVKFCPKCGADLRSVAAPVQPQAPVPPQAPVQQAPFQLPNQQPDQNHPQ